MNISPLPPVVQIPRENFYRILNVDLTASAEEIKKALTRELRLWSNRTNAPQLERRQEAERMVKLLEEAETILLNPATKTEYDQQLRSAPSEKRQIDESDLREKQDLVQEGWRLLIDGNVPDALYVATKATEKDGSNPEAWTLLAQAKFRWGDIDDAIYEYKRAIKLRPNEASYYFDLGSVYESTERWDEALQQYERASKIDPASPMFRAGIGILFVKTKRYQPGIDVLKQCVQEDADNSTYRWFLAIAYAEGAYENWTFVPPDNVASIRLPSGSGYYATSKEQVIQAQRMVAEAENLKVDDPDLSTYIKEVRNGIDAMLTRKFYGSTSSAIIGGIIWTFVYGLGLIFGPLYFVASRPPQYAINKRIIAGHDTADQQATGFGDYVFTGLFLPIMVIWNFIKNYTGANKP